jgi:hypothetical protein
MRKNYNAITHTELAAIFMQLRRVVSEHYTCTGNVTNITSMCLLERMRSGKGVRE